MREIQARGVTIVFVSHYLEQAREFSERILWLDNGAVVADGSPREVIQHYIEAVTYPV